MKDEFGNDGLREELSPDREKAAAELESLARWMDSVFEIPGIRLRFGIDALLGLVPGAGDVATSAVSVYILAAAFKQGLPRITLLRMVLNIGVDLVLGAVPFVGDLFDTVWKSNQRNVVLLRKHLEANPRVERKLEASDWLFVACLIGIIVALTVGSIALAYLGLRWLIATLSGSG